MYVWSGVSTESGKPDFVPPVRDRYELIASVVLTEVSALPEKIRNEMDLRAWAEYTMKAMREEFPDMSGLTEMVGYVSHITLWVKEWVLRTLEWVYPDGVYRTLSDRLVEMHQRREMMAMSESREFERIVQKAWRWAIRRSGYDYDRSVQFVEYVSKRAIEYQTRYMD